MYVWYDLLVRHLRKSLDIARHYGIILDVHGLFTFLFLNLEHFRESNPTLCPNARRLQTP